MTLWRLTLPDVIPEESLPFIEDACLTFQGLPIYCIMDSIPDADNWLKVLNVLNGDLGQGANRPYRNWLNQKINHYYPKRVALLKTFSDRDVSDMAFNVSEFPSAPIFATLSRVQYVDLNQLKY